MGLFSTLLGDASEADSEKIQRDLEKILVPGEVVGKAYKMVRDAFVFTDSRLIIIDKQGLTGAKTAYHSVLYRSITQFAVETAGDFDADAELKIWLSGLADPISKTVLRGSDVLGMQRYLASCIFGRPLSEG